jgi:2-keto-myo-inositol isomerase
MIPTLAQVCTLNASFESDLEDYAAGQCRSVELWFGKLENYLQAHTPAQVRDLLAHHGLQAPVASFQGGLLTTQGDARREHWQLFERRLQLCAELQIGTIVLAGDIAAPLTQQDLERVHVSLRQAAQQAAQQGIRLAFEFQAAAPLANNLQSAASLITEIGESNLGLCLDLFHYYCGPSKPEDFGYLTPENLFHVQLCDLAGIARELATDADRIVPGDGDIQVAPLIEHLHAINYRGAVSMELMNHQIWQMSPRTFGEIGMTALRKILGQAVMG